MCPKILSFESVPIPSSHLAILKETVDFYHYKLYPRGPQDVVAIRQE